jgi:DNA-binding NtrC family response regulator
MSPLSPELYTSHAIPSSGTVTLGRSRKSDICIDDPLASREHARLNVALVKGAPVFTIEDCESVNGTRVRDVVIPPRQPTHITVGEGVVIGSTVVMVLQDRSPSGHWRLGSPVYFGARLEEACARADETKAPFALMRLRFSKAASLPTVLPILSSHLSTTQCCAMYGPRDYEILVSGMPQAQGEELLARLLDAFHEAGLEARGALAWHPKHGRTGDALMAAANAALRAPGSAAVSPELAPHQSAAMKSTRETVARIAPTQITVLIRGETGVGKDVFARLIHKLSPRAGKPFLSINCAAIPEGLLESELFGHEKAAFNGAVAKKGLLEAAEGGTVFLDEIGDMSPMLQAKLLTVLQRREVRHVGGLTDRPIDVRFVAATNKNLEEAVRKGAFRDDLKFRLGTTLTVPPLRERRDEIEFLARSFVERASAEAARSPVPTLAPETIELLLSHDWPGNVRELENAMEQAVAMCDGGEIRPHHLGLQLKTSVTTTAVVGLSVAQIAEKELIERTLAENGGNQTVSAQILGMSRGTFIAKLKQYGIPRPHKGGPGRQDTEERPRES